ncbi:hypothetical protein JW977_02340 [Candidatus Falkowbacteria bacterium]|nr:hypothetical protein [Candidatus Falkowbacteria bacterium]
MQTTFFSDQPLYLLLFLIVMIWSFVWKGIALWKSARDGSKPWFVVLLLVNTIGILEILYIYVFSKMKKEQTQTTI